MNIKEYCSNKIIGILSGGISNEREVSLRSGANIKRILDPHGYNTVLIDLQKREDLALELSKHKVDIVFNALHGFYGEDGQLQADLNYLGIPYTGCNVSASSIGMNKYWSKLIAKSLGFYTAEYVVLEKGELLNSKEIPFDYPYFIKPMLEGSSQDTHIIKNKEEEKNLKLINDKPYLVEKMIIGEEVTSGILSYKGHEVILPVLKLVAHNEFYDYEAKYTAGKTEFFCPAPISTELTLQIQSFSSKMHQVLGCKGATRCDYIIEDKTGYPYFLEINTSPGMTQLSDIPMEAKALGWSEIQLCEFILSSAL